MKEPAKGRDIGSFEWKPAAVDATMSVPSLGEPWKPCHRQTITVHNDQGATVIRVAATVRWTRATKTPRQWDWLERWAHWQVACMEWRRAQHAHGIPDPEPLPPTQWMLDDLINAVENRQQEHETWFDPVVVRETDETILIQSRGEAGLDHPEYCVWQNSVLTPPQAEWMRRWRDAQDDYRELPRGAVCRDLWAAINNQPLGEPW